MLHDHTLLLHAYHKITAGMEAFELCLPVIHIVITLPVIAVKDAYGIHLLDLIVFIPDVYVFGYGFAGAIQDALQIIQLTCQLHLHQYKMPPAVLCLDVHAVELILGRILVALTLQYLLNMHCFSGKDCDKSLKNIEICLVAKHMLHSPVKTYVCIFLSHNLSFLRVPLFFTKIMDFSCYHKLQQIKF